VLGPINHVLDSGEHPLTGRGNFGGCPAHRKALGASDAVYAAKRIILILNNDMTGDCNAPKWGQFYITCPL